MATLGGVRAGHLCSQGYRRGESGSLELAPPLFVYFSGSSEANGEDCHRLLLIAEERRMDNCPSLSSWLETRYADLSFDGVKLPDEIRQGIEDAGGRYVP